MFKKINNTLSFLAISSSLIQSCSKNTKDAKDFFTNDEVVLQGKFCNGLSYYIKENSYDQKKASLRLAVKVGSICEEEEERGLAHFVEHMVFRGSTNYRDGDVIRYLESIGAAFGAHTNAYTSYDETVYMFDIPLNKKDNLKTALSILSEFAMKANLSKEQLEIEKGVVLDELRISESSSQGRFQEKICEFLLENNLYGQRRPIGLRSVIQNCNEEKIKNFYTKWYKPENIAIIAVGDFSSEEVFGYFKEFFESLPKSSDVSIYSRPKVEAFDKITVNVYENPENMGSHIYITRWLDNREIISIQDFKEDLVDSIIKSIANRRLEIQTQKDPSPFQRGFVGTSPFIHSKTAFFHYCSCWDKTSPVSISSFMKEFYSLSRDLFSQKELEIAILKTKSAFQTALENAANHTNAEYAMSYIKHFMRGGVLFSLKNSTKLSLDLLEKITLEEVNQRKRKFFNEEAFKVVYFPSEKAEKISEQEILSLIEEQKNTLLDLEERKESSKLDLHSKDSKGEILDSVVFENTNIEVVTLSNGMKVYMQPSNVKENLFSCVLRADSGWNAYEESLYPSALAACGYLEKSGLAGLSKLELQDALAGKVTNISYGMDLYHRYIKGVSSNQDMEVFFKLTQSLFTDGVNKQLPWNQHMQSVDHQFELRESNSDMKFHEFVSSVVYNNHYGFKFYSSKEMSKTASESILEAVFGDPKEFSVVVVGDYKKEKLLSSLEEYLASIKPRRSMKNVVFNQLDFPEGIVCRIFDEFGVGSESQVFLSFPVDKLKIQSEFKHFYQVFLVENILKTRFLEQLRSKTGETYSVHCYTQFPFYPKIDGGRFFVFFSTSPDKVDMMVELLLDEMKKALESLIQPQEIEKAREIYRHHKSNFLLTNEGMVDRIIKNILFNADFGEFISDSEDHKEILGEELKEVVKGLINLNNYSICIKKPKESPKEL